MIVKRIFAAALIVVMPMVTLAAEQLELLEAKPNLSDKASLQRGAKLFVNFCLSCHSLRFMRYNRMGRDVGLTDEQVENNLLFAAEKVVENMEVAMSPENAKEWFGVAPPDLSVVARSRGANWLYSYLVTFYRDDNPARPFGVNNIVFRDVAMPHVFWSQQGVQEYVVGERPGNVKSESPGSLEASGTDILIRKSLVLDDGSHASATDRLAVVQAGMMEPGQFRRSARDLVNFLVYAAEPAQLVRYKIGIWVLVFLVVLFVVSYGMYKEYWKDVH